MLSKGWARRGVEALAGLADYLANGVEFCIAPAATKWPALRITWSQAGLHMIRRHVHVKLQL